MPTTSPLTASAPWSELRVTEADWDAADPDLLVTMHSHLVLIRVFEEYVLSLAGAGLVHGPAHSSIGQEGGAVGSVLALRPGDTVNGSHRGHHQFLAKALAHVAPGGLDLRAAVKDDVRTVMDRTLAEICGLTRGFCSGRGGSVHLQWIEAGAMGTNAIVGGGAPHAAGFAFAHRRAGTDAVSVNYLGDGAANIGSVLESFNLAAAWQLPVCFFVENNLYAVSTRIDEVTAEPRLSARGAGFGIPAWRVDGQDPLAVYLAMSAAVAHMAAGRGPTLVEAVTYRYFHQNGPFPGSAFGYRTKEEERDWRARDPLSITAGHLVRRGILTESEIVQATAAARELMESIGDEFFEQVPGGRPGDRRIRAELWPDPATRNDGIRGDLSELTGVRTVELDSFTSPLADGRFIDSVAAVMSRRMSADERILVMGEDVHRLGGGTNGATKGLADLFGDRVLGTPISENAFTGLACGLAMDGRYRPVLEFMYADFLWVAADQLFNQIGKARHMFGGRGAVPLVLRAKVGTGTGYGTQHSMDPAGIFATSPGWRIVAPATPFDYVGLMNTALALDDPVLVIEHVELYSSTGPAPVTDLDYHLPFGKAAIVRTGSDITVLTYLSMVAHSLRAARTVDGVDAEVIDLRWLDHASLDWETIGESIRKTNNVLIVEQGTAGTSYGAWLAEEIGRRYFDWLDQPVQRLTGAEASPPICKVLESACITGQADIADALRAHDPHRTGR